MDGYLNDPHIRSRWRFVLLLMVSLLYSAAASAQTAESYRQEALQLSRAKSWDQAAATYRKALALEPDDAATHYNLALALKYGGNSRQAAEEFDAALRLRPKWADAHYGLGAARYDLQDQAGAAKELRTAVELDPSNAGAHRLLARIYSQQNDFLAAEAELRRAIASKPSADLYFELGLSEGQLGKPDSAAAEFRRAVRLEPGFAPAHTMLGVTLRRQGDHVGALAEFRRSRSIPTTRSHRQIWAWS